MIFATYFPDCQDIHLTKDVGLIPYVLHREYGYDSSIICFKNGDYPRLETDVPGLKLVFMKGREPVMDNYSSSKHLMKIRLRLKDLSYFVRNLTGFLSLSRSYLKSIDVLNIYHFKIESLVIYLLFKAINKHGITYLKADLQPEIIEFYRENPRKLRSNLLDNPLSVIFKLAKFNVITVETKKLYEFCNNFHPLTRHYQNIYYLPNGIDFQSLPALVKSYKDRENIILHVARIGAPQKCSDIVLKSFEKISKSHRDWKLVLIGEMHKDFIGYFNRFLFENKDIAHNICYAGLIQSRKQLFDHYLNAKIIAMPSRWESFGLVAMEAMACGDVMIGSDLISLRELTGNGEFGYLCPVNDVKSFTNMLNFMVSHEDELKEKSRYAMNYVRENYDIKNICEQLHKIIVNEASIQLK